MTISYTKLSYGSTDANYTVSVVSQITDNAATPTIEKAVVTGLPFDPQNPTPLAGDPRVLGFTDGSGNERVLVTNYSYTGWNPGTAEFGIFDPSTNPWTSVTVRTNSQWSKLNNPYGIARLDNANMFVAEYDDGLIDKISLTNYAEVLTGGNAFYTFPAVSGYTAHCAGIGVYDGKIVALFNQGQGYSSYIASTLAIINPSDGSAVYLGPTGNDDPNNLPAGLGQNALGLTVDGGFAYVSSYGGPQQGGGNTTSKLEAVNLSTLTITGTHTAGSDGMGDFTSVAINGTDAYVLRASYTATWDQYNYNIYKTTTVVLQSNAPIISPPFNSGLEPPSGTTTTIYPGATWLLALTGGRLWAVLGDRVKAFDISGATPALDFEKTEYAYDANGNPAELGYYPAAADHTAPNNGEDNHLNTAAIAQTNVPAPTVTRGAPAAPSYSVSNRGAQHPAFISRTPEALKLRKKLIEEWKKNKK